MLGKCKKKKKCLRYGALCFCGGRGGWPHLCLFHYLATHVPEDVPDVWHARILDASHRTTGSVVGVLVDLEKKFC